jgi:phosphoglycolate phosphatase
MIPNSRPDALAAIVFDWDGTLMDSVGRIVRCLQLARAEIGAGPRSDEEMRDIIGLGVREATLTLYPGADDAFVAAFTQAYRRFYLEIDVTPTPLFEGAEAVLSELAARGYLLGIATGKSRRGLDEALEASGLKRFFDATATADEHPSKPHPAMLEDVLGRLGVNPDDAVMVGDSIFDLEMANNLAVRGIGITHGVHDAQRLQCYRPAALIRSLFELPGLLAVGRD